MFNRKFSVENPLFFIYITLANIMTFETTKALLFLLTLFTFIFNYGQISPEDKGFESHTIKTKNDTINFYIHNPKKITKEHLFIHIDGSYPDPLWIETNPCCVLHLTLLHMNLFQTNMLML